MARIGVINISDGRDHVHDGVAEFILANEGKLVRGLEAAVVDLTVLRYCVWAFPHLTVRAADGVLDQVGRAHIRLRVTPRTTRPSASVRAPRTR